MRRRTLLAILAAGVCGAALRTPCAANEAGYNVWFAGRVIAVDAGRGRLRVARGPTETSGPRIEECVVTGADLHAVRPGMRIEAQADTRRRPWRVLHLRVMRHAPAASGTEMQTV